MTQLSNATVGTVLRSVPLHGTNGLTVDHQDHLIIASIGTKAVVVMDTETGEVIRTFRDPLIIAPDDVAMGADGSITLPTFLPAISAGSRRTERYRCW